MTSSQRNSPDIEQWLKLAGAENVGPVTFGKLLNYFGSPERALGASVSQLMKIEGIGPHIAEGIAASRDKVSIAEELELAEKLGVWIIHLQDERYLPLLKQIYDPGVAFCAHSGGHRFYNLLRYGPRH